jgi:hypothetical protein
MPKTATGEQEERKMQHSLGKGKHLVKIAIGDRRLIKLKK